MARSPSHSTAGHPYPRRDGRRQTASETLSLLDAFAYGELAEVRLPTSADGVLEKLVGESFVIARENGNFDITNLGAISFARSLRSFGLECARRQELRRATLVDCIEGVRLEREKGWHMCSGSLSMEASLTPSKQALRIVRIRRACIDMATERTNALTYLVHVLARRFRTRPHAATMPVASSTMADGSGVAVTTVRSNDPFQSDTPSAPTL